MGAGEATVVDHLNAEQNPKLRSLLAKTAEAVGSIAESVVYSGAVMKVNRKGSHQQRFLVVTDHALYNFKTRKLKSYQRRIELMKIAQIYRLDTDPNDFVVAGAPGQIRAPARAIHPTRRSPYAVAQCKMSTTTDLAPWMRVSSSRR